MTTKTFTITNSTEHKPGNIYLCEDELFILTEVKGLSTLISLLTGLPYNPFPLKLHDTITHSDWEFLTDECHDSFKLVKTVDFNVTL